MGCSLFYLSKWEFPQWGLQSTLGIDSLSKHWYKRIHQSYQNIKKHTGYLRLTSGDTLQLDNFLG